MRERPGRAGGGGVSYKTVQAQRYGYHSEYNVVGTDSSHETEMLIVVLIYDSSLILQFLPIRGSFFLFIPFISPESVRITQAIHLVSATKRNPRNELGD